MTTAVFILSLCLLEKVLRQALSSHAQQEPIVPDLGTAKEMIVYPAQVEPTAQKELPSQLFAHRENIIQSKGPKQQVTASCALGGIIVPVWAPSLLMPVVLANFQ
ncbi:hypothetical protein JD844_031444 [Phrynosoma platyrhinos]|uniref:Uncharacterized protein n=1 Tax=Phrynosoma platyrhinos TaxID=52577 RepID=A0ABQ7T0P5_PHRPL|nr:hypothetical protein JD844_031444 [Phrynosoma platyrhinos]